MAPKTEQLQIRISPEQKAQLRRRARASGQGLSAYILSRLLPLAGAHFGAVLDALGRAADPRFPLAELSDFLSQCPPGRFAEAVAQADLAGLPPHLRNYVAAMVEQAADQKGVGPPAWTRSVAPLEEPWFAAPLAGLRLHLLSASPVPFKRRNLFVDAGVGARV
jgi:hypothetical protein